MFLTCQLSEQAHVTNEMLHLVGDVRCCLVVFHKIAPFRDHQHLLPDMFVRCDARKHRHYFSILTDVVFVRQDAKKGPRSTMALGR